MNKFPTLIAIKCTSNERVGRSIVMECIVLKNHTISKDNVKLLTGMRIVEKFFMVGYL